MKISLGRKIAIGLTSILLAVLLWQLAVVAGELATNAGDNMTLSSSSHQLVNVAQAQSIFFGGKEDVIKEKVGATSGLAAGAAKGETSVDFIRRLIAQLAFWLMSLLATISVLSLIYAGFLWVTARGTPEQIGKAKQVIAYAIAGLLLAFFSFAIVTAITSLPGQEAEIGGEKAAPSGASRTGGPATTDTGSSAGGPAQPSPAAGGPAEPAGGSKQENGGPATVEPGKLDLPESTFF